MTITDTRLFETAVGVFRETTKRRGLRGSVEARYLELAAAPRLPVLSASDLRAAAEDLIKIADHLEGKPRE